MNDFAGRLRKLRKEQGYTQQQLANLLGVTKSAISMYENREREPELSMIQKIATILNVDMDELAGNSTPTETISLSPFQNMEKLIARNGKLLTEDERNRLIDLLNDL
ncbi:MAG: helix-turn-helix transcriptional regulator [Clostridium sp.]|nr:helix-turn-helix transcriptional regulator [Clostridium sp.]